MRCLTLEVGSLGSVKCLQFSPMRPESPELITKRSRYCLLAAGFCLWIILAWLGNKFGLPSASAWVGATVLLMALWWISQPLPLWATALLPLLLFPLFGGLPFTQVLGAYFDPVNFLFFGGMLIAACMEQWMLHRRLALGIVSRLGVSPRRIVLGFILATGFITLWISNTATALLMYPIGLAVLSKFAEQRPPEDPEIRRFGAALMLGIAYAASIGGVGSKIGTGPNMILVKQSAVAGLTDISFLTWLKIGLPIVVVCLPLVWLYLVRIAEPVPDSEFVGGREAIESARAQQGPMSRGECVALAGFLTAAFLWTFRQEMDLGFIRIPGWADSIPWTWKGLIGGAYQTLPAPLAKLLSSAGAESQIAVGIGVGLMLVPIHFRPLQFALSHRAAKGIAWDMLIVLGGGFAMAEGIQRSGLSDVIAGGLKALPAIHPFLTLLAVALLTTALSEVASNVATVSIMLPLVAALAKGLGVHPAPLMFAATLAASFGFMLPAGTPPNAIVYASGYLTVPQMARNGLLVDVFGAVVIAVVCYWVAPWALGLPR